PLRRGDRPRLRPDRGAPPAPDGPLEARLPGRGARRPGSRAPRAGALVGALAPRQGQRGDGRAPGDAVRPGRRGGLATRGRGGLAPRVARTRWYLEGGGGLSATAPPGSTTSRHVVDPTVGIASLGWDPWTTTLDPAVPHDQSADDARSLAFTSPPLPAPLELVGSPAAVLDLAVSTSPVPVVAKLADVAPNGRSTLVPLGWLGLPRPPGERHRVTVPLRATAYRVAAGHRLRLSLAGADFPRIWPAAAAAELTLYHGASHVELPVAAAGGPLPAPAW